MSKIVKRYPFTIIVIIAIIYLSFSRPPGIEKIEVPFFDKWGHMCMYAGLTGMIWFEYLRTHRQNFRFRKIIIGGIIFPVLLGGVIEIGQHYLTTYRSGDWLDFAANSTGVVIAVLVGYYILRPYFTKTSEKQQ